MKNIFSLFVAIVALTVLAGCSSKVDKSAVLDAQAHNSQIGISTDGQVYSFNQDFSAETLTNSPTLVPAGFWYRTFHSVAVLQARTDAQLHASDIGISVKGQAYLFGKHFSSPSKISTPAIVEKTKLPWYTRAYDFTKHTILWVLVLGGLGALTYFVVKNWKTVTADYTKYEPAVVSDAGKVYTVTVKDAKSVVSWFSKLVSWVKGLFTQKSVPAPVTVTSPTATAAPASAPAAAPIVNTPPATE